MTARLYLLRHGETEWNRDGNRYAGRTDLADKEARELVVVETFLPQPLSAEELESLIRATIQELGATSKKEMGPVMKAVQDLFGTNK